MVEHVDAFVDYRYIHDDLAFSHHVVGRVIVMSIVTERYLVDESGNRIAVVMNLDDYRRLLADVEELDAIRAYDAAKASGETPVPFAQAIAELDRRPE